MILLVKQSICTVCPGSEDTVIDGMGLTTSVVTCISGETGDTILEGFTIANGTQGTLNSSNYICDSRMYVVNSNPTVNQCNFVSNALSGQYETHGGGLCQLGSSPEITDCNFLDNTSASDYLGERKIPMGGAVFIQNSSIEILNCSFETNSTSIGSGGYNRGGAIACTNNSIINITECSFTGNHTERGLDWEELFISIPLQIL